METSPGATLDGERNFLCLSLDSESFYVAGEADRLQSVNEVTLDLE